MRLFQWAADWIFPRKCVLCQKILNRDELDLCHECRCNAPDFTQRSGKIRYISSLTALWHYEGNVRCSLLRYKFHNARSLAQSYGRLLAMRILEDFGEDIDIITWVPVSRNRKRQRGYDQVELIARAVCKELGRPLTACLVKHTDTKPNSGLSTPEERRANVCGVYHLMPGVCVEGKRILLLDDIVTTGATTSECARMLLSGGAREVHLAAVAAARKEH